MDINGFYNYAVHIIRPKYTEIGEPELKNSRNKYQDNNELIIHNTIINSRLNQIPYMIQRFLPLFQDSYTISLGLISDFFLSCKNCVCGGGGILFGIPNWYFSPVNQLLTDCMLN